MLKPITIEWFELGVYLGLQSSTLTAIKANESEVADRKREMVISWLQQKDESNPTWQALVTALEDVDRRDIACQIKEKHMA